MSDCVFSSCDLFLEPEVSVYCLFIRSSLWFHTVEEFFMGISLQLTLPRDGGVLHRAVKDTWTEWELSGSCFENKVVYSVT